MQFSKNVALSYVAFLTKVDKVPLLQLQNTYRDIYHIKIYIVIFARMKKARFNKGFYSINVKVPISNHSKLELRYILQPVSMCYSRNKSRVNEGKRGREY